MQKLEERRDGTFKLTVEVADTVLLTGWIEAWREKAGHYFGKENADPIDNKKGDVAKLVSNFSHILFFYNYPLQLHLVVSSSFLILG